MSHSCSIFSSLLFHMVQIACPLFRATLFMPLPSIAPVECVIHGSPKGSQFQDGHRFRRAGCSNMFHRGKWHSCRISYPWAEEEEDHTTDRYTHPPARCRFRMTGCSKHILLRISFRHISFPQRRFPDGFREELGWLWRSVLAQERQWPS
jgi:hypothetical protein